MKKFIFLILLLFFTFDFKTLSIAEDQKVLKLYYIHSYDENFTCTLPQKTGIDEEIRKITNYRIFAKESYMKAKTVNITPQQREFVGDIFIQKIKNFNPDYIFITDDPAFRYSGMKLANDGFKILVSGLNKPLSEYKKEFPELKTENIVAVDETIRLDPIFQIFEQSRFSPKYWYILHDDDFVSYYMKKDYERELEGKGVTKEQKITTIQELRSFLSETQNKNEKSVYVIALQTLKDIDKGKYVSKEEFFKEFLFYNKYNLELGGNPEFANIGISICCGPDFKMMGEKLGYYFRNNILGKTFQPAEMVGITTVFVNTKRLMELKYLFLATNGIKIIKETVDTY